MFNYHEITNLALYCFTSTPSDTLFDNRQQAYKTFMSLKIDHFLYSV